MRGFVFPDTPFASGATNVARTGALDQTSRTMKTILALALATVSVPAFADTASYSVIFGGKNLGHLVADTQGDTTKVDYDYKNNGRGPTIKEVIRSNADGLP